jgi:transcriptional regulator
MVVRPSGNALSPASPLELLQGTLDLLILKVLSGGPSHGYGIGLAIRDASGERLIVEDKALYVSLHRMEEREWVASQWGVSDNNRKARYYQLTAAGRKVLRQKTSDWTDYVDAVFRVLHPAGGTA